METKDVLTLMLGTATLVVLFIGLIITLIEKFQKRK
ncbi:MAG: putative holin-like toxin [Candidatus Cohnella colombiensis]|uniref:Holin-like toxin n=1 Tax=Candidatus Cohnella colombiensis TaxID=3121368 RepID=A0AA95ETT4_9BACL|nr:MAG: putative holin-like toxin [Cohnella sp.]